MQAGLQISIIGHGALIGWALFGAQLFSAERSPEIAISEVSVITEQEFAALKSTSPTPAVEDIATLPEIQTPASTEQPVVAEPPAPAPVEQPQEVAQAAEAEQQPDLSALTQPATPDLQVDTQELNPQANDTVDQSLALPIAPVGPSETQGQDAPEQLALLDTSPKAAPRIDTRSAPKPPADAKEDPVAQQETAPDPTAEVEPETPSEQTAPPQSTTKIVTEADNSNAEAPQASARPRSRPSRIANMEANAQRARERRAEAHAAKIAREAAAEAALAARQAEQAQEDIDRSEAAKAIEAALREAQAASPATDLGPPLTSGERGALVLSVQACWNPPIGVQNDADLVVMLGVELNPNGTVVPSSIRLLDPPGTPQGVLRQAYEAGRRAIIRCAPYTLPREKYEQWRQLEVVFNPQNMVVR